MYQIPLSNFFEFLFFSYALWQKINQTNSILKGLYQNLWRSLDTRRWKNSKTHASHVFESCIRTASHVFESLLFTAKMSLTLLRQKSYLSGPTRVVFWATSPSWYDCEFRCRCFSILDAVIVGRILLYFIAHAPELFCVFRYDIAELFGFVWIFIVPSSECLWSWSDGRQEVKNIYMFQIIFSPSRRREAPCEGTNSPRLFTPGETKALAKSKVHQISRAWVTVITVRGWSSSLISKIWRTVMNSEHSDWSNLKFAL
jgi:hypothetical protein